MRQCDSLLELLIQSRQARVCDLCDDGESTVVDCGSMVHVLPAALAHLHETYHAQTATFTLLIKNATAAENSPRDKRICSNFRECSPCFFSLPRGKSTDCLFTSVYWINTVYHLTFNKATLIIVLSTCARLTVYFQQNNFVTIRVSPSISICLAPTVRK